MSLEVNFAISIQKIIRGFLARKNLMATNPGYSKFLNRQRFHFFPTNQDPFDLISSCTYRTSKTHKSNPSITIYHPSQKPQCDLESLSSCAYPMNSVEIESIIYITALTKQAIDFLKIDVFTAELYVKVDIEILNFPESAVQVPGRVQEILKIDSSSKNSPQRAEEISLSKDIGMKSLEDISEIRENTENLAEIEPEEKNTGNMVVNPINDAMKDPRESQRVKAADYPSYEPEINSKDDSKSESKERKNGLTQRLMNSVISNQENLSNQIEEHQRKIADDKKLPKINKASSQADLESALDLSIAKLSEKSKDLPLPSYLTKKLSQLNTINPVLKHPASQTSNKLAILSKLQISEKTLKNSTGYNFKFPKTKALSIDLSRSKLPESTKLAFDFANPLSVKNEESKNHLTESPITRKKVLRADNKFVNSANVSLIPNKVNEVPVKNPYNSEWSQKLLKKFYNLDVKIDKSSALLPKLKIFKFRKSNVKKLLIVGNK